MKAGANIRCDRISYDEKMGDGGKSNSSFTRKRHRWCAPENASLLGSGRQFTVKARPSTSRFVGRDAVQQQEGQGQENHDGGDDLPLCRYAQGTVRAFQEVHWPDYSAPSRNAALDRCEVLFR